MKVLSLLFFFLWVSCATRTPVTDKLTAREKDHFRHKISDVPLLKQDDYHCGPAALTMVLNYQGKKVTEKEMAQGLFHKKLKGSFFPEMKARAREEGMMVLELNKLQDVIAEVRADHPVIILQNNGFAFFPRWHFAVMTGLDLNGPDVFLHDGDVKVHEMDMRWFERSFVLGGYRSLLILPPGKLGVTVSEVDHVEAATILETMGKKSEARMAYEAILGKWPGSIVGSLGLSNVLYGEGKKKESQEVLEKTVVLHPESPLLWHNLAVLRGENGNRKKASLAAQEAIKLADEKQKERFKLSLRDWL